MNRATELTARALGVYAGLIALQHGIGEILQGPSATDGLMVNAIGPPCEPEAVWHACLPAMTVLPTLRVAGVITTGFSLMLIAWCTIHRSRARRGPIISLLSLLILVSGGGFVAPFTSLAAAAGASLSRRVGPGWGRRVPLLSSRGLATLWPWTLLGLGLWLPGGWLLGHLFPSAMMRLSLLIFFLVDVLLPIITVLAALAQDAHMVSAGVTTRSEPRPDRFRTLSSSSQHRARKNDTR
jgi:hypothetical protein